LNEKQNKPDDLRKAAVDKLARSRLALVNPQPGEDLLHELMHELQVHQVELEMQNVELRKSQLALEESRDRYVELYEFAPIGYFTIGSEGMINEVNLTGCGLLGVERTKLIDRRFSKFVAPKDRDRWDRHFINMMSAATFNKETLEVVMVRTDGSIFYAHLDCVRRKLSDDKPALRVAMGDNTELKLAEAKLRIAAS